MTDINSAASATSRANGPIWSRLDANATRPWRDTRPYVGLNPTTPLRAAGWRIEPPVSDPSAPAERPAATAAAEPPEDPPAPRVGPHGFRKGKTPAWRVADPIANSSRFVLPMIVAPAARRRETTVASYGARYFSRIFDPHVVGVSVVHKLSFRAIGTPASGPVGCSSDGSSLRFRNALIFGSTDRIRSKWWRVTSRAESLRVRTRSAISRAGK